jgi:hypothetical protein
MGHYKNEQITAQEAGINTDHVEVPEIAVDDLDLADTLLEQGRDATDFEERFASAQLATAHIQLWWAKETRAAREAGEAYRKMMDNNRPPPPPLPVPPYLGF